MKFPTDINKDSSGFVSLIAASMLLALAVIFSGGLALTKQAAANGASETAQATAVINDTIVVTATRLR